MKTKKPQNEAIQKAVKKYKKANNRKNRDNWDSPVGPPQYVGNDGYNDPDLVGSGGNVQNADGTTHTIPGNNEMEGGLTEGAGGGGTGSALAGRESSGLVGDTAGRSIEDVVYGVGKKSRKIARPRGE